VFTTYALLSSLALAHRILTVGVHELTSEYLVDVVVLTWLTGVHFVWMMAGGPVSATTAAADRYGQVIDRQPAALWLAGVVGVSAPVTARLVHGADGDAGLFRSRFRTALVTLPGAVTATVLLARPGADSLLWPVVAGVVLGTRVAGLLHLEAVATWTFRGTFAVAALLTWTVGAAAWVLVYRSRPPTVEVVLDPVSFDLPERTETRAEVPPSGRPADDDG
jgi:hypothetical protein